MISDIGFVDIRRPVSCICSGLSILGNYFIIIFLYEKINDFLFLFSGGENYVHSAYIKNHVLYANEQILVSICVYMIIKCSCYISVLF